MAIQPYPEVALVPAMAPEPRTWPGDAAALRDPGAAGRHRVTGGPGTGKTTLLADLAVAHAGAGAAVTVLAHSKEAAANLRADIAARLADDVAGDGGMVRSVHSLAFAVVRAAHVRGEEPEPSLMTGARQDAIIHELLTGDATANWPERLQPALGMRGLTRQVRDLLLRAQERGVGADGLRELGVAHGIPEWTAAGAFLDQYHQVMRLSGETAYNASELVAAAVEQLHADPGLLDAAAADVLLVDDAQHLDPKSAELVELLAGRARLTVVTGDPGQTVLSFRGADGEFLKRFGDDSTRLELPVSHRLGDGVAGAVAKLRREREAPADHPATVAVHVHDTAAGERADIAAFLRRAHLEDGIAWRDMAVIVRSGAVDTPLHRTLARAGVPVRIDPTDIVLADQRMVNALLLALEILVGEPDELAWERLLTGPLGQADAVTLNRLVRAARGARPDNRGMDTVIEHLTAPAGRELDDVFADALGDGRPRALLDRVRGILEAGREALPDGIEATLWGLWDAAGLSEALLAASLRGGATGAAADRDLDAVIALFDFAGDIVEDNPRMTPRGFLDHVRAQELPTGVRDRRGAPRDAVAVVTAHGALGLQWRAVAVAGLQDDDWPSLTETGSLLRQQELVDLIDRGIEPGTPVSHLTERLREERRLFGVAISRASEKLLVTAVDDPDNTGEPSRFISELGFDLEAAREAAKAVAGEGITVAGDERIITEPPRVPEADALVAELRAAVADTTQGPGQRRRAATQLARLAEAGVPAADPAEWWGLTVSSSDRPVREGTVHVSPSKVDRMLQCPLRVLLEQSEQAPALSAGTIFHAAAEALAKGVPLEDVEPVFLDGLARVLDEPGWRLPAIIDEWAQALQAWANWADARPDADIEEKIEATIGDGVVISGRIDRLERDGGAYRAVDIKTSKSPVTVAEAEEHAQLAAYQVALHAGGRPSAGAMLVYPRKPITSGPSQRTQAGLTDEAREQWISDIVAAAGDIRGPGSVAKPGAHCDTCQVRLACPAVTNQMGAGR